MKLTKQELIDQWRDITGDLTAFLFAVEIRGKDPIVTKAGEAYLEPVNTVMRATNKG